MDARQTAHLGLLAKGREQPLQPFVLAQQARTGDRGEGHPYQQLRVVADTGPLAGVGPAPVEHVFAVRVRLHIGRQRRAQPPLQIAQHAMSRAPAGSGRHAVAVFQRGQESMTQEWLGGRQQGVPLGGVDIGKGGKRLDRHARQSGARRKASEAGRWKKAPGGPAMKPPFTKRRLRSILRRAHNANGVIRRYPAATAERKLGTLRVGRITPEALSADNRRDGG